MRCPDCMTEMIHVGYYTRECPHCHFTTRFNIEEITTRPELDEGWGF